jgi:hypothetical protein
LFILETFLNIVIDLDQVVRGTAVFSKSGLFWADYAFGFHEPGEARCDYPFEDFAQA